MYCFYFRLHETDFSSRLGSRGDRFGVNGVYVGVNFVDKTVWGKQLVIGFPFLSIGLVHVTVSFYRRPGPVRVPSEVFIKSTESILLTWGIVIKTKVT